MIVCHCRLVTDAALRDLVASGECEQLDALTERCGAAAECGGCREGIEALLAKWQDRAPASEKVGASAR